MTIVIVDTTRDQWRHLPTSFPPGCRPVSVALGDVLYRGREREGERGIDKFRDSADIQNANHIKLLIPLFKCIDLYDFINFLLRKSAS